MLPSSHVLPKSFTVICGVERNERDVSAVKSCANGAPGWRSIDFMHRQGSQLFYDPGRKHDEESGFAVVDIRFSDDHLLTRMNFQIGTNRNIHIA